MFKFGCISRALAKPPKPLSGQQSGSQQFPDRGVFPSSASQQRGYIGKTAHSHPRRPVAKPGQPVPSPPQQRVHRSACCVLLLSVPA